MVRVLGKADRRAVHAVIFSVFESRLMKGGILFLSSVAPLTLTENALAVLHQNK